MHVSSATGGSRGGGGAVGRGHAATALAPPARPQHGNDGTGPTEVSQRHPPAVGRPTDLAIHAVSGQVRMHHNMYPLIECECCLDIATSCTI